MRFGRFFFLLVFIYQPLFGAEPSIKPIFLDDLEEDAQAPKVLPRQVPDPAKENLDAILKNLNADEILELTEKDQSKFKVVYKQGLAKNINGSILILPGDGLYPMRLKSIIMQMANKGWDVLSLSLPYYPRLEIIDERQIPPVKIYAQMPKPTDTKKTDEDKNNKFEPSFQGKVADLDPPPTSVVEANLFEDEQEQAPQALLTKKTPIAEVQKNYSQKIQNRLDAGLNELNQRRQNDWISLVLHRENAYLIKEKLSNNLLPKSIPIVFLNTVAPKAYAEDALSKSIIALGRRPILDIYNPRNIQEAKLAKLRFAAYKRAGNDLAIQVKEYSKATDRQKHIDNWIAQRIWGWVRGLEKTHPKIKYGILSK